MTIFMLKIIALVTMFLDHVKYAFPDNIYFDNVITYYFGRISYPLFAFILTEGYLHTSNLKKYLKRMIIFALISQIPFMLFRTLVGKQLLSNIIFTLLLGLIAIMSLDKSENEFISFLCLVGCYVLAILLNVDYGIWGLSIIIIFYIFKNNKVLLSLSYILANLLYYYSMLKERLFAGGIILI